MEFQVVSKAKWDTDHSSSNSKLPSVHNSPAKEENTPVKISNLSKRSNEFPEILWVFLSQRYASYIGLLRECKMDHNHFGPLLRDALQSHFSDIIWIEYKDLINYCKEENLDKVDMLVLQFALQIFRLLSRDVGDITDQWKVTHEKELSELKFLHDRIRLSFEHIKSSLSDDDKRKTSIYNLLKFYAIVFPDQDISLEVEELSKDENLEALRCAKALLSKSNAGKKIDKVISQIAGKASKNVERKRKTSPKRNILVQSQDPKDLLTSLRKKRSLGSSHLGEINLEEADSPNMKSMGVIDLYNHRSKRRYDTYQSLSNSQTIENPKFKKEQSQCSLELKNTDKLSSQNDLKSLWFDHSQETGRKSVTRKQDKSKIQKYSPFKNRNSISKDKMVKRKSYAQKGGSNSFLSSHLQQTGKMAIKKGRKDEKKKEAPKLSGALGLISKTSFAVVKAKEVKEKEPEKEHEKNKFATPKKSSLKTHWKEMDRSGDSLDDILQMKDVEMKDDENSRDAVLVYNTPTKSEIFSYDQKEDEFNF
jgi:hypothetical protein